MREKRKWERLLALVLAVVLIFSSVPESALAATFGLIQRETEAVMEPVTETEAVTEAGSETGTEAEPESEMESKSGEETESESMEPESGSETESEIMEPESGSGTAAETDPQPETETEVQIVTAEQDMDGAVLEVSYPEDAFEEEVALKAEAVAEDDGQYDAMKKALDELQEKNESFAYDELILFDIAFVNADGEKAEPSKEVSVSLKLDAEKIPENVESAALAHLPDNGVGGGRTCGERAVQRGFHGGHIPEH